MSVQQDINLPNPNPTIINLYTHTIRDKVTNRQNDHIFDFKISKTTLPSRRKISDQIVIITSDSGATYNVLLYDLLFSWIASHKFKQTLPVDDEGNLLLMIKDVSDSALERFLRLSLIRVFYGAGVLGLPPDLDDAQYDTDLKSLLTLADTFEVGIQIRRRIMHDIYAHLLKITQVCSKSGWTSQKIQKWLGWVVFGIEEKPIVLWLIEMTIIYNVTHAGSDRDRDHDRVSNSAQNCLIRADWYGEYKKNEPITSPYNTKITRGKDLVQNLCYLNILLQQMLTQFPTFNLPESMYNTVRQVYGVLRSSKVKFNGKSISQQCDEIFVKATQPLPGTHKVSPASSTPASSSSASSSSSSPSSSSLPPLTAASAASQPYLTPSGQHIQLKTVKELKEWFYSDPRKVLDSIISAHIQERITENNSTLLENEKNLMAVLQNSGKTNNAIQVAIKLQNDVLDSIKKLIELTQEKERAIKLVNEQLNQYPRPPDFDSNVELMLSDIQRVAEQTLTYVRLRDEIIKMVQSNKNPIIQPSPPSSPSQSPSSQSSPHIFIDPSTKVHAELEREISDFISNPRRTLNVFLKKYTQENDLNKLKETNEAFLIKLQRDAKSGSGNAILASKSQETAVEIIKKVVLLSEDAKRIILLVNQQISQSPRPQDFDKIVKVMFLTIEDLNNERLLYERLAIEVERLYKPVNTPKQKSESPQRLTGAQKRAASRAASQQ